MTSNQEVGRNGEELVAGLLTDQGYSVLARNWRGTGGEIDIVALDGHTLVGVEVKTRTSLRFGHPAEAITARKVARMRRVLGEWLAHNRAGCGGLFRDIRLDVVAVTMPCSTDEPAPAQVDVLKGVS
ncbi:MAG: YraN family protein [Cellulomonadaceae bacterium]|jgi:putative endonuclease|nr:YraN family protein [Cellulomonadaceae bacterium]